MTAGRLVLRGGSALVRRVALGCAPGLQFLGALVVRSAPRRGSARAARRSRPRSRVDRARQPISAAAVHLASLPMDDPAESATIVNALQRHATRGHAKEPRGGIRPHGRRGDVEGAPGRCLADRWDPEPDRRRRERRTASAIRATSRRSVAALISRATDVDPYFIGKPNPLMMRSALNALGAHSESTTMIGDGWIPISSPVPRRDSRRFSC
jgi:hypothetical protein